MATQSLTANGTATLTMNGTSTVTGSIRWTVPTAPADGTLTSIYISGTWSWSGRGNVTRVTINGTNTTTGVAFNIKLPNTQTSPLSITAVGGNKNTTGSNFSWQRLQITYTYTLPDKQKISIVVNGSVAVAKRVWKVINGVAVEQTDYSTVFDGSTHYKIN